MCHWLTSLFLVKQEINANADWRYLFCTAFIICWWIAGYLESLFGVGGGVVLVQVFLTIFSFFNASYEAVMHNTVGTSLALLVPNALLSARNHYKRGNFDFPLLK